MIKVDVNREEQKVEVNGHVTELLSDLCFTGNAIYMRLTEEDKAFFRMAMQEATAENGAMWMTPEQLREKNRKLFRSLALKLVDMMFGKKSEEEADESHS